MPASRMRRRSRANSLDSFVSRPAAGSSMHTSCGRAARARAGADELALALADLVRHAVAEVRDPQHVEREVDVGAVAGPVGHHEVEEEPADRLLLGGHAEVVADVQVVEQLERLPGSSEPEPLASVRRQVVDLVSVETDPARRADESGEAVDERGLAGAVRADQPDDLALVDVEIDLVDGLEAAERHRHRRRLEEAHRRHHRLPAGARPRLRRSGRPVSRTGV